MKRARHYPLKTEKVPSAEELTAAGLRFMVDNYYQSQAMRKRSDMQKRHFGDRIDTLDERTLGILNFTNESFADIEHQVSLMFGKILKGNSVAQWMLAQRGIGPIIATGLLAHIDITKAPTVGHIWRFAGLDPTLKWEKGQKRPFNAALKQLTWHAGQCFMKQSNDPDCFYGRLYRERKKLDAERNERGEFAERAKTFKVSPGATKAVKDKLAKGQLPDFNIDARARRYAVKIFLSHLHVVMYWDYFKKASPKPFAISIKGHAHEIRVPYIEMFPGLAAAYYGEREECLQAAE